MGILGYFHLARTKWPSQQAAQGGCLLMRVGMSKFQLARFLILPLLDIFVFLVVMMQAVVQAFLYLASHMDRRPGGLHLLQSALKVCSSAQVAPSGCA
jgi:hypothetical protein